MGWSNGCDWLDGSSINLTRPIGFSCMGTSVSFHQWLPQEKVGGMELCFCESAGVTTPVTPTAATPLPTIKTCQSGTTCTAYSELNVVTQNSSEFLIQFNVVMLPVLSLAANLETYKSRVLVERQSCQNICPANWSNTDLHRRNVQYISTMENSVQIKDCFISWIIITMSYKCVFWWVKHWIWR